MANGGSVDWKTVAMSVSALLVAVAGWAIKDKLATIETTFSTRMLAVEARLATIESSFTSIDKTRAAEREEYKAKMADHDRQFADIRALLAPYSGWHEQRNQRDRDQDQRLLDLEAMFDRKRDGVWDGELEFEGG